MRSMLLALLVLPKVYGQGKYDVVPGVHPSDIIGPTQFGVKVQEMMGNMPQWKKQLLKYFPPAHREFHHDPRVEAIHPDMSIETVVRKAAEKLLGEKLDDEPNTKVQKFGDADPLADPDAPPVKPVTPQNDDEDEDNMIWMGVGGVAVGAALVWSISTKGRQQFSIDGGAGRNAGYARLPEKRSHASAMTSDSSGDDRASRSTESYSNTGPTSDIYSRIRSSFQDSDPTTVWKSVKQSFATSDVDSAASPTQPSDRSKLQYAETSSVSHTDSEEEISEVYDRVKKSLKNLNLLPKKPQDTPQGSSSGGSRT